MYNQYGYTYKQYHIYLNCVHLFLINVCINLEIYIYLINNNDWIYDILKLVDHSTVISFDRKDLYMNKLLTFMKKEYLAKLIKLETVHINECGFCSARNVESFGHLFKCKNCELNELKKRNKD